MRLKKATGTYTAYAGVYDSFKGDRSETIRLLASLIRKHHPEAKTLLDLACGTGGIAQGLIDSYELVGLDNAPAMLRLAREKLPHTPLLLANMVDFKIKQKFDVIYCLHNSVNHILTFHEWQSMFTNVAAHLNKNGIFIFDINPIEKMDELAQSGPFVTQVRQDYVITQVTKDAIESGLYDWGVKIFSRHRGNNFLLHDEIIKVSSHPLDQVSHALMNNFDIVDFFILNQADKSEDIGRAYYVGLANQ